MKIIETSPDAWPAQMACTSCKATLEVEASEIKGPSRDYTGDSNDDAWFDCLACGHQQSVAVFVREKAHRWLALQPQVEPEEFKPFRFGPPDVGQDARGGCCGKPVGCTIDSQGCLHKVEKTAWQERVRS